MPIHNFAHKKLTPSQKELWLGYKNLPEDTKDLAFGAIFHLDSCPDPILTQKALQILVKQYPLLSSGMALGEDGMPYFINNLHTKPQYVYKDFSKEPDPAACLAALHKSISLKSFDPLNEPLIYFALAKISQNKSILFIKAFHIINDGYSLINQFFALTNIYESLKQGVSWEYEYSPDWNDVVALKEQYLTTSKSKKDKQIIADYYKNIPSSRVFTPLSNKSNNLGISKSYRTVMPDTAQDLLEKVSEKYSVSIALIFTVLHATYLGILYDTDNIITQFPIYTGNRKNIYAMQGYNINSLPLIVDLSKNIPFSELLQTSSAGIRKLYAHVKTPVQHALRKQGILSKCPYIFDTFINYMPLEPQSESKDFSISHTEVLISEYENTILGVQIVPVYDDKVHLSCILIYSTNYFTQEDMQKYMLGMEILLNALWEDKNLYDISLISPQEKKQIDSWQHGEKKDYFSCSIPELFLKIARKNPHAPAVCAPQSFLDISVKSDTALQETSWHDKHKCIQSYADICKNASELASTLQEHGIAQGEIVAVLARRHISLAETILGIMACGAVYLPIDPDYPIDRIKYMLQDSGTRCLVLLHANDVKIAETIGVDSPQEFLIIPTPFANDFHAIDKNIEIASSEKHISPEILPTLPCIAKGSDLAYLIYTSGSTGKPKAVALQHKAFVNMIQGQIEAFGIKPKHRALQFASPSFDASLSEIFMALMAGASLYPVPQCLTISPWSLKKYLEMQDIHIATLPPSYLALFNHEDFPSLKTLITAGESPIDEDVEYYAQKLQYFNAYGPTESAVCATLNRLHQGDCYQSIGRPLPNTSVYILDSHGRQCPQGVAGELWLAGANLAQGYYKKPELTAQNFTKPINIDERCYGTGDRALWLENGTILSLGRIDEQVKIRGHRVELNEIVLMLESFPEISQACVICVGKARQQELKAFVIFKENTQCTTEHLYSKLSEKMPSYMVPHLFYILESFPITPSGKIDKKALENLATKSFNVKSPSKIDFSNLDLAQKNIASQIQKTFEKVLGQPLIDTQLDFFRMGGDSLKAAELLHLLEEKHNIHLSMRIFLDNATLDYVLQKALIESKREITLDTSYANSIARHNPDVLSNEPNPPIYLTKAQYSLWVQHYLRPSAQYVMPFALQLEGNEKQIQDFTNAFSEALALQPLFTSLIYDPQMPEEMPEEIQEEKIATSITPDVNSIKTPYFKPHTCHIPPYILHNMQDASPEQIRHSLSEYIHITFDLAKEAQLKLHLFQTNKNTYTLLLVLHHIVADAQSLLTILNDTLHILEGKDFLSLAHANILREHEQNENSYLASLENKQDAIFWKNYLNDIPCMHSLMQKLFSVGKAQLSGKGQQFKKELSLKQTANLHKMAKEHSTSVLTYFIALTTRFIQEYAQFDTILVTVPTSTREHASHTGIASYFVNPIPLIVSKQNGLKEYIQNTHTNLRNTLLHNRFHSSLLPNLFTETMANSANNILNVQKNTLRQALNTLLITHMDFTLPSFDKYLSVSPVEIELETAKNAMTCVLLTNISNNQKVKSQNNIASTTSNEINDCKSSLMFEYDTQYIAMPKARQFFVAWHHFMELILDNEEEKAFAFAHEMGRKNLASHTINDANITNATPPSKTLSYIEQGHAFIKKMQRKELPIDNTKYDLNKTNYMGNKSEFETLFAHYWQKILGLAPKNNSHFFQSGGDSIKAIQIVSALRRQNVYELNPADFFEIPNFTLLCQHVLEKQKSANAENDNAKKSTIENVQDQEKIALLPLQAKWIQEYPQSWRHFFMALPIRIGKNIAIENLKEGIIALMQQHEALQMAFTEYGALYTPSTMLKPFIINVPCHEESSLQHCFSKSAQELFAHITIPNPENLSPLCDKVCTINKNHNNNTTIDKDKTSDKASNALYGAVFFQYEANDYCLFGIHHFIADAISLDILRKELLSYCQTGTFPLKPSQGMASWAKNLQIQRTYANPTATKALHFSKKYLQEENEFWHNIVHENIENKQESQESIMPQTKASIAANISSVEAQLTKLLSLNIHDKQAMHHRIQAQIRLDNFNYIHAPLSTNTHSLQYSIEQSTKNNSQNTNVIQDSLADFLGTLAFTLKQYGQRQSLLIDVERHGREDLLPHLDISQSVGWFTSTFPIRLSIQNSLEEQIASIQEQCATMPHKGALYTFNASLAQKDYTLKNINYTAPISFNYLGNVCNNDDIQTDCTDNSIAYDNTLETLASFAMPTCMPTLFDANFTPHTALDCILYSDAPNTLTLSIFFSPLYIEKESMQDFLNHWAQALSSLMQKRIQFPQNSWAALAEKCLCKNHDIARIAPINSAQKIILFQYLLDEDSENQYYTQQLTFQIENTLNADILEKAWQFCLNRHEGLRSLFPYDDNSEHKALILKTARHSIERSDIRSLPLELQNKHLENILQEQRHRRFDPTKGPLLFFHLIQCSDEADEDKWYMTWCFSHILMDGWCLGILLGELFQAYMDILTQQTSALAPAPTLHAYEHYLTLQDPKISQEFWINYLAKHEQNSFITKPRHDINQINTLYLNENLTHNSLASLKKIPQILEYEYSLDYEAGQSIKDIAAHFSISFSLFVQAMWSLVLADFTHEPLGSSTNSHNLDSDSLNSHTLKDSTHEYDLKSQNDERDILYGLVVSGRPAHIPEIANTIGLFIRTLPVRVRWNSEMLLADLLNYMRKDSIMRLARETDSLSDIFSYIQKASSTNSERDIFDHILIFENYPLNSLHVENAPSFSLVSGHESQPYPLSISVLNFEQIAFRFNYDSLKISTNYLHSIVKKLDTLFKTLHTIFQEKPAQLDSYTCGELENILQNVTSIDEAPSKRSKAYVEGINSVHANNVIPNNVSANHAYITTNKGEMSKVEIDTVEKDRTAYLLQTLYAKLNDTERYYPEDYTIHDLFFANAKENPLAIACVDKNSVAWTYEAISIIALRIANALINILPEPRISENMKTLSSSDYAKDEAQNIAIYMPRGPENIAVMLAVLLTGNSYMPLDEHNSKQRLQNNMNIARCKHLIYFDEKPDFLQNAQNSLNFHSYIDILQTSIKYTWEQRSQASADNKST